MVQEINAVDLLALLELLDECATSEPGGVEQVIERVRAYINGDPIEALWSESYMRFLEEKDGLWRPRLIRVREIHKQLGIVAPENW